MVNESGGISSFIIIISLTKKGHSSINSLSFLPSCPLVASVVSLTLMVRRLSVGHGNGGGKIRCLHIRMKPNGPVVGTI
jgi:hypothetical protein